MTNKMLLILFLCLLSLTTFSQTMPAGADPVVWAKALKIHRKAIIVDGHNDLPSPMVDEDFDLAANTLGKYHKDGDPFHTDLARLKASGITGEFFSIYVSSRFVASGGSMRRAMDMIDATYRAAEKYPGQLTICTTAAEIRRAKKQKKTCALMGIEGGHAIEDSLYALRSFYRLGVRYMTLTHNNTNNWADACCSDPKHDGLSDFGREVVKEMNRIGMLVDISHVSDATMNDVFDASTAPVIYSHSSVRAFANRTRNVPDDILKRLAANGGVIMINFYPGFLDQQFYDDNLARDKRLKPELDAISETYKNDQEALNEARRKLYAANPIKFPSYTKIVDHIDHVKKIAGIDYVGIGSDYDGIPYLPEGMNGAEDLVLVTYEMLRRGYTETEIKKVLGENFMRSFSKAEQVAGSRQISGQGNLKRIK